MDKYTGKFIVSLDFELMWGVRDAVSVKAYGDNIRGVHQALPGILDYFKQYNICGTFAIVGLLFFESKEELLNNLPERKPQYNDQHLSPYGTYITESVGTDSYDDPYHFAPHLIQLIKNTPNQEIGTHTFSHFYCLEEGQTVEDFSEDLKAAIAIANKQGINITSIIFPRNQTNDNYLEVCKKMGITNYRSNEDSWIYSAQSMGNESLLKRFFRLVDTYCNISGHHCYTAAYMQSTPVINIPSSRFLRPYSARLRLLEKFRLRRIKRSMTHAAKNGLLYHLWWHPHNFGINQEQNFSFLEKILEHYTHLNKKYGFTSYTMSDMAKLLLKNKQEI